MPELSIVIPVFQSETTIELLIVRVIDSLKVLGHSFELILVDDGSGDKSWQKITSLAGSHNEIRGIRLNKNSGEHAATLCGIRCARGKAIITLDDDLQNPPEEISKLYARLNEGFDAVYGIPIRHAQNPLRSYATSFAKHFMRLAIGIKSATEISSFRCFWTRLRDGFEHFEGRHVSVDVLISWTTQRFANVSVEHDNRAAGRSSYSYWKLLKYTVNFMINSTTVPLRIASILGFSFTIFGLGILMVVLINYLAYGAIVPGFVFLASIVSIFSGVQMFATGIMGEYLAQIFGRSMRQPTYLVQEMTSERRQSSFSSANVST